MVNLHYRDDDGDVDEEEYDDDEDDEKEEYDDDGDIYQHASALVGELGPLYCPQTPLVLRFQNQNKSK